ncbi:PhzF family phenazine biosynthesis protein [Marinobacter nanhaiticus D15-8W]|uniref:PhzF family phenazine biosynthesis protein n=1 Tax=Marinobacter nanhaiticus D15-8W TaxID=626887 RepID=N6WXW8_9GAMM|nr:PhzF family phenazine biosynthesis protein [Marinobacter nanhaiticus]ENO16446.1 PhzF family phenazine biosynthesis protein [Marinobacter nanhaiticus D15-8W]BES72233.1 PhzF family phenazine biosynthesis protein [Marinobacter nanhaiticus D15-8W]
MTTVALNQALPLYQVDAFATRPFTGNPAAVMPLEEWLEDDLMQAIALENNLSETAFFVREPEQAEDDFHIRWFTPEVEVPLCGHATLASAWVIFNKLGWGQEHVRFRSKSGSLGVRQLENGWLELDFPRLAFEPRETPKAILEGIPEAPENAFYVASDTNYMLVFQNETQVRSLRPDMKALKTLGNLGVIVTAPGDNGDFVSRYFAPGGGIDEDPVTGSIHSILTPYWAERLGKSKLQAHQVSSRGGELRCELHGDRVHIAGQAVPFMEGQVKL